MLDAMRNLGILKMIDVLVDEFEPSALESVEAFTEQRKKAIINGTYAKLQFEPIDNETIGIFSLDSYGNVQFIEENVSDDSWKYLFLKTSPRGIYATPTWKREEKNKKIIGDAKLKRTVEKYIEDSKHNDAEWLQKIAKIFLSGSIEIGELKESGEIEKKTFYDTITWAMKTKNIKVFSIKIEGKYNADIDEVLEIAWHNKPNEYQTKDAKFLNSCEAKCSLCNMGGDLFPNVLSGVGINISNVDKPVFFPGVDKDNSCKAFPICASCAEALYAAKFHVFNRDSELRQDISGHKTLIIPHLVKSDNRNEGLEIVIDALRRYKKEIPEGQAAERNIIKDLSQIKSISTVTFVIGDVSGQNIENIRKIIPDVLPSRLSQIAIAIDETNDLFGSLPIDHPWKLDQGKQQIDGSLGLIRDIFGMPKYKEPLSKGKRAPYKASYVDSLNILNSIFLNKNYPIKDIIAEFSSKLSYDFLGAMSDKTSVASPRGTETNIAHQVYSIRTNISKMMCLIFFLEKVGVIEMEQGKSYVSKYLENHEGLKPLNTFLSDESKGINTKEKEYAFLVGLLLGKLVSIQMAKRISINAIKWLKGLQLSQHDLLDIFVKTKSKLDNYSVAKNAWSDEMKGVAEAIGALGADIENWDMSRKEIAFYLCIGQSLSGYYLPSKSKFESYEGSD